MNKILFKIFDNKKFFFTIIILICILIFIYTSSIYYIEDEFYINQWALKSENSIDINYEKAIKLYNSLHNKSNVIVAILDTGVDINHFELSSNIYENKNEIPNDNIDNDLNGFIDDYNGWNFVDNNNQIFVDTKDDEHGTHSAGTIIGKCNNGGIKGICDNEHIKLLPIKILGKDMLGKTQNLISAIDYAIKSGASIINISLGTPTFSSNLEEIIRRNQDILFVIASGNTKSGLDIDKNKIYPASFEFENVITVGNMNKDGTKYETSNYGKNTLNIFAPGVSIISTIPNNQFAYLTGSSMATAFVSGTSALIKSANKLLSPKEIKYYIENYSKKINSLIEYSSSGGCLDSYSSLKEAIKGGTND